ncbi:hypothetical protein PoB_005499800 [Plakobranchus ocellatus]|uniref:Uncharacterized protein n=1 Tax=Plakobranchus ocellatus TaxID=259542 RepID=A0AAV4C9C2_9GAST|nr:hypothetical protein PoB_005499800 [Plakobranchus ocellatus]
MDASNINKSNILLASANCILDVLVKYMGASVAQWLVNPHEILRDPSVAGSSPAIGAPSRRRALKPEITLLWTGCIQ